VPDVPVELVEPLVLVPELLVDVEAVVPEPLVLLLVGGAA
jgi:hypothetical protein